MFMGSKVTFEEDDPFCLRCSNMSSATSSQLTLAL